MKRYWLVCALTTVVNLPAPAQTLKVEPDPENIFHKRLEGEWQLVPEMSKKLGGGGRRMTTFKVDLTVLTTPNKFSKIPEKLEEYLKKERIYLAGHFNGEYPFLLTSYKGVPFLFYFLPKGANIFGNPESFHLFIAVGRERENDLLFIGGDRAEEAFSVYERRKK